VRLQASVLAALAVTVAWITVNATGLLPEVVFWAFNLLLVIGLFAVQILVTVVMLGTSGPIRLDVREGRGFLVRASRGAEVMAGGFVLLVGLLGGQSVHAWVHPSFGGPVRYAYAGFMAVLAGLTVILCVPVVGRVLRGRPVLALTPGALVVTDIFGTRRYPWDALRPGLPVWPDSRRTLRLTVDRPDLVTRTGLPVTVNWVALQAAHVHPGFAADVIRFYVDHPDRRAALGTRAEYDDLLDHQLIVSRQPSPL
jgi:hypothetical protein